jgi:uncharacterized FlgJ-related protein
VKFVSRWAVPQPTGIVINNTHLLRAAMLFVVLGVVGPGLFQLKPPQWFGDSADVGNPDMAGPAPAQPKLAPAQPKLLTAQPELLTAQAEITPQVTPQIEPQDAVPVSGPVSSPPLVGPLPEQPAIAARKTLPAPPQSVAAAGVSAPQETKLAALEPRSTRRPAIPGRSVPPLVVMRDFAKQIPQSHVTLPVKRQKESFIAITLPLILAANEEISQRRKAIERAVSRGDQAGVVRWARLYRIETEGRSIAEIERQLLLRADFVPVSLALAQAAIESGWGTSRFALQGNALFGQWAWQKDAGLKPARASNNQAVVRSFPNLFGSVRAYMHNLNTHPRYAGFRARRHLLRGRTKADLGYQLSNFLDGYAEIGEVYVAKLKALIRSNDLGRYEAARLR